MISSCIARSNNRNKALKSTALEIIQKQWKANVYQDRNEQFRRHYHDMLRDKIKAKRIESYTPLMGHVRRMYAYLTEQIDAEITNMMVKHVMI